MKRKTTDIVREALRAVKFVKNPRDIFCFCGADTAKDKQNVRVILGMFRQNGELVKDGDRFRFAGKVRREGFCVADRVWRAWRYCSVWTVAEIARIAECTMGNVRLLVLQYKRAGHVEAVGRRGRYKLYRLRDRDMRIRPVVKHG